MSSSSRSSSSSSGGGGAASLAVAVPAPLVLAALQHLGNVLFLEVILVLFRRRRSSLARGCSASSARFSCSPTPWQCPLPRGHPRPLQEAEEQPRSRLQC